jgi:hypothetical protein
MRRFNLLHREPALLPTRRARLPDRVDRRWPLAHDVPFADARAGGMPRPGRLCDATPITGGAARFTPLGVATFPIQ